MFPDSNRGFPCSPPNSGPASISAGRPRLLVWTVVSILMDGWAILAAAIRWNARTLPITTRAFLETVLRFDRFVERGAAGSGVGERDGSVLKSVSKSGSEMGWEICSDDRSGQLWKLSREGVSKARFLIAGGARGSRTSQRRRNSKSCDLVYGRSTIRQRLLFNGRVNRGIVWIMKSWRS